MEFINATVEQEEESNDKIGYREEIPIEKGVVLTDSYLSDNIDICEKYCNFFSTYPDLFLDLIKNENEEMSLFFYQRIILRALMRYKEIYLVACRATSKTFLSILALFLQCVFMPGTKRFIVAPFKVQAAKVAKEKVLEIYQHWPLLRREIIGGDISETPGNFSKDYVTLKFRNGSQLDVVGGDSTRGLRRHGGLLDELRDADEVEINEIVLPLMNVSRRLPDNTVNKKEPNQQQIVMTSAGVKSHFSYEKLIDMFENAIINPQNAFVIGLDYRIPLLHDLLDRDYVNKLKMSPSFNAESFAREYLSLWSGSSEDSWFNYDKLSKYRKLKNPEWAYQKVRVGTSGFYLLAMDVGRLSDRSEVCIFRVNPQSNGIYYATLVNIVTLGRTPETRQFSYQARDLKRLIRLYNPKEVLIDTNGLGVSMADEMIKQHYDLDGTLLPSYGFFNNEDYKKIQPKDSINILYSMKANGPLNSQIHGNAYSRVAGGRVHFLISEQEAKSALLATQIGQRMKTEDKVKRLLPHQQTSNLFEQMANLRMKRTGTGLDIVLEQINERFPKDKYSAFAYGLWRIKELEDEAAKKTRNRSGARRLVFYTEGG